MCFCVLKLLNLLEVIIDSAGSKSSYEKPRVPASEPLSGPQTSAIDADVHMDSGIMSSGVNASVKVVESSKATSSGTDKEYESQRVLSNMPQAELKLLCSLLAQEGYDYELMIVKYAYSVICIMLMCLG